MQPSRNHRVESLAERLRELAGKDPEFKVFGAWTFETGHQYRLNPCLSESELRQFETGFDVTLPEDYRDFLLNVGNGGAGPYYGLLPLREAAAGDRGVPRSQEFLSSSFMLRSAFNPYYANNDEDPFNDRYIYGSIRLAHQGCGYYDLLVICGPERGRVWTDGRVSDQGIIPLNLDFCEWYERWLDESLAEVK